MPKPTSVLFVCLGNICRSPLAEGVFIHLAEQRGVADRFEVDSCGTGGWHAGSRPDPRSIAVAKKHGVHLPGSARQLDAESDARFDLVVAMDDSNRASLVEAGIPGARICLLRDFDPDANREPATPGSRDVPDPYYGGPDGFDDAYDMVRRSCAALLDHLLNPSAR